MNNYAVTSGDMSEALSRFASVANSSGVEAYQAISYAMGTNESIQNAEKTGNSLKTIITNLNGLRTSAKDGKYIAGSRKIGHMCRNTHGKKD